MTAERKGKAPYTEKISTHLPSGRCVHSTSAYGDALDPLEMYYGKDCMEKFKNHTEDKVKGLYETFP